jgi:high-affinity iron transporter
LTDEQAFVIDEQVKAIFNFISAGTWRRALTLSIGWLGVCGLFGSQARAVPERHPAERLAAVAAYIAADYPGAVKNGQVVADSEYREQRGLIAEAASLVAELSPSAGGTHARDALRDAVARLSKDVDARADAAQVANDCRVINRRLLDDFNLVLAPAAPPSLERARSLYRQACKDCHGQDGRADTEKAKELNPPPVSFFDEERMRRISPSLAFHALSFGVNQTAMAAFDTLSAQDRWSLAFYVVGLRHAGHDAARGEVIFGAAKLPLAASPSRLAELSDEELDSVIGARIAAADRPLVLSFLRTSAPYQPEAGGPFAGARRLLRELSAHAETHPEDRARARELAIAAYLEGVEPHEAALRARDPQLCDHLERAFFAVRERIEGGDDAEAIRREATRAMLALDTVEERGRGDATVPFFAALAIALREGFELSLLLAALLAFLRRAGHAEHARYVHLGWVLAIPAGVLTWFAVGAALAGARRELTEAILTLLAATMLLFVSHFVLGRIESRRWLKFLEKRTTGAPHPFPLATVAFVAAYREGIEIVLFFRALVLDSPGFTVAVLLGAGTGLLLLSVLVVGMQRLGRRLDPRPLMLASSVLLTAIALSMVGQGIRALQEGGYLHVRALPLPSLPRLGLYATAEGLAVQLIVLACVIGPTLYERRRANATRLS